MFRGGKGALFERGDLFIAEGSAASLVLTAADRVLEAASTIQAQYLEEATAGGVGWAEWGEGFEQLV